MQRISIKERDVLILDTGPTQNIQIIDNPHLKVISVTLYRNMKGVPGLPIEKTTPWNDLSIQDKMFLCAYGSSGNKLSKKDLVEIERKYGQ